MTPYKFTKIKTLGLSNGRWEVLLEDGSFLEGVTSILLEKPVGELGKATITLVLPEKFVDEKTTS